MIHKITDVQYTRRFQTRVLSHSFPSTGSTGQARPGLYTIHPDSASMIAEPAKTHSLCWLSVIRKGAELASAATLAPMPKVTSAIGNAQQTSVPVEANRVNQVVPVSMRGVSDSTHRLSIGLITEFYLHQDDWLSYSDR